MKKHIAIFMLFIGFLALCVLPSFGAETNKQLEGKIKSLQNKIAKATNNINTLKQKLKVSKSQSEKTNITKLLNEEDARVLQFKKELIEAKKRHGDAIITPFVGSLLRGETALAAGYIGGAAVAELGYLYPINPKYGLDINLGYGMAASGFSSNPYSLTFCRGGIARIVTPQFYIGAGIDWVNYSKRVQDIFGTPGAIAAGGVFGVGAFAERIFGNMIVEVGYSTVLGVNLSGIYRF